MARDMTEVALRTTIIEAKRGDLPARQGVDDDLDSLFAGPEALVKPPYEPRYLALLPERSDQLPTVLDSLTTVIERMGQTLERVVPPGHSVPPDVEQDELDAERARAETLLSSLSADGIEEMRAKSRYDKELLGARAFEVLRDYDPDEMPEGAEPLNGALPTAMEHVPSMSVFLTYPEDLPVKVRRWRRNSDGEWEAMYQLRRFRRFCQARSGSLQRIWFKEYGDPRHMDATTGQYVSDATAAQFLEDAKNGKPARLATEIIYDRYYSARTPYGMTPWAGCTLDIGTNRGIDEQNWLLLENGLHVPMVLLVSGGFLSAESKERLQEKIEEFTGKENWHKVMVIEAAPAEGGGDPMDGATKLNSVRMELKSGKQFTSGDELHQKVKAANDEKIRQRRRMPPILIGAAQDFNFATAFASLMMFEIMVAWPARRETDRIFNELLFPEHNIRYWRVKSKGVKIADFAELATIINAATEAGALSPNEVRNLLSDLLDVDLPAYDEAEHPWAGKPIKVTATEGNEEQTSRAAQAAVQALVQAFRSKRTGAGAEDDVGRAV